MELTTFYRLPVVNAAFFVGKDCANEGRSPLRDRAATQKEVVQIPQLMVQ